MFKKVLIGTSLITVTLLISACTTTGNVEPVTVPSPSTEKIVTPEVTPTPVIQQVTDVEYSELLGYTNGISGLWKVDATGLIENAGAKPNDFTGDQEYFTVFFNKEDMSEEAFVSWMNEQPWTAEWVEYVPSEVDKIWGFEGSIGKEHTQEDWLITYKDSDHYDTEERDLVEISFFL